MLQPAIPTLRDRASAHESASDNNSRGERCDAPHTGTQRIPARDVQPGVVLRQFHHQVRQYKSTSSAVARPTTHRAPDDKSRSRRSPGAVPNSAPPHSTSLSESPDRPSRCLPAPRQPARQHQEQRGEAEQHRDLRRQRRERRLAPEHLDVAVQRPGVEGDERGIFCSSSLIRKRGNMLPPSAFRLSTRRFASPELLPRAASVASTRPNAAAAAAVHTVMIDEARQVRQQRQLEHEHAPHEHHGDLHACRAR